MESTNPDRGFVTADVGAAEAGQDNYGFPALGLRMRGDRAEAFGEFTRANTRRRLAAVVDGQVVTLASINEPLYDRYQLSGGTDGLFRDEVTTWVAALRYGPLPAPLNCIETQAPR